MMQIYDKLISIDPSKKFLKFLAERVLLDNYRGIQVSQHNRYDVDYVITLLEEFYKLIGENKMTIRTTDLKKRPENLPEERIYAQYTNNVQKISGKGTQDSIRKNFFVDLHRMGLINRYDKNKNILDPYSRSSVKYVALTDMAINLIKSKDDTFNKKLIYTKSLDHLMKGLPNSILDIALLFDGYIDLYELMFFISFLGENLNGKTILMNEIVEYIKEYRSLSKYQKEAVIDVIREYCNPDKFSGNKTNKRDFGNWKNEEQQILTLMNQTVLFEYLTDVERLNVKVGKEKDGIYESKEKLKRSIQSKQDYFDNHKVTKRIGFELHHIIPLLTANNRLEFDALDVWENMIYIDGYTHGKISQTGNKNVVLNFDDCKIILSDYSKVLDDIVCEKDVNVLYDIDNKIAMKNYNTQTLNSLK